MIEILLTLVVCGMLYFIKLFAKSRNTFVESLKLSITKHTYVEIHNKEKSPNSSRKALGLTRKKP